MITHCRMTAALLTASLIPFFSASAATVAPKVVFLGDQVTLGWTGAFAANPNWINKGVPVTGYETAGTFHAGLARFQSDVVSLHPAIVHIMFGLDDFETTSPASLEYFEVDILSDVKAIVQEARAANIQVVFGLEAGAFPQTNAIISIYAAENNIPVINYGDALCQCGASGTSYIYPGFTIGSDNAARYASYLMPDPGDSEGVVPTAVGYSVMTRMAEASLYTLALKLQGGYLQNVELNYQGDAFANVNSVSPYHTVQFSPLGQYTGGLVEPLTNTNYLTGSNGIWASSNPLVMDVNQQGYAMALTPGTATISYMPPSGVRFHEWVMSVVPAP